MRQIVSSLDIDTTDVLGVLGLLVLCLGVAQFDPRWVPIVIGVALLLVAVAYARQPDIVSPPSPPEE